MSPCFSLVETPAKRGLLWKIGPKAVLKAISEWFRDLQKNLGFGRFYDGIAVALGSRLIAKIALVLHASPSRHSIQCDVIAPPTER